MTKRNQAILIAIGTLIVILLVAVIILLLLQNNGTNDAANRSATITRIVELAKTPYIR